MNNEISRQDVLEQFFSFIGERTVLTPAIRDALAQEGRIVEVKKGHCLLHEDTVPRHIWYLAKGSVRTYYYHNDKEITSWIYDQNQMITAYGSFYAQIKSYDNIQCTEDCILVQLSYDQLQSLYALFSEMQIFGRVLNEEIVMTVDQFSKGFLFMSAREKYKMMLEFFPEVAQRVNLGYIASFLGINQATLSRIRSAKS